MATRKRWGGRRQIGRLVLPKFHWDRDVLAVTALAAGGQSTSNIVVPGDYAANTALSPSGVTLFRTVGEFSVMPLAAGPLGNYYGWWAIYAQDVDATVPSAASGADLTNERVLAAGVFGFVLHSVAAGAGGFPSTIVRFDTKVRVKLADSTIRLCIALDAASPAGVQLHATWAALLRGDTN